MIENKLRLDKYLWAIRLFKTRSLASEACEKGKVKYNGVAVKASKAIHINEEYEIKTAQKRWIIKVIELLDHRVQYKEAINYYLNITPETEFNHIQFQASTFYTGKRLSKIGRPTKKDKRNLDQFMDD